MALCFIVRVVLHSDAKLAQEVFGPLLSWSLFHKEWQVRMAALRVAETFVLHSHLWST